METSPRTEEAGTCWGSMSPCARATASDRAGPEQAPVAGRVQPRPAPRAPQRRRLGGVLDRDRARGGRGLRGVPREQGRHVRVRADAQPQHVEERAAPGAERLVAARRVELLAVPGGRLGQRHAVGGRGHQVHVPLGEPGRLQRLEHARPDLDRVAVLVVGADEALVAPPQVQGLERHAGGLEGGRQRVRGEHADGPARHDEMSGAPLVLRLAQPRGGVLGGGRGDRRGVGEDTVRRLRLAGREGRRVVHAGEGVREDLAVDLVGVQPAELLGEQLVQGPARHGDVLVAVVAGQGEHDRVLAGAAQGDGAVGPLQADAEHPLAGGAGIGGGEGDLDAEGVLEPRLHEHDRGVVLLAGDLDRGGHRDGGDLVEARHETAPGGQSRPGEVRIAARVPAAEALERAQRVRAGGRVGDAALGHGAQHVVHGGGRRRLRPPGDDRRVGQQQRHDQGVQRDHAVPAGAQDDDLAGAGVAAHADLRVEAGALRLGVHVHDDHAGGVLVGGVDGRVERLVDGLAGRDDDEREDPADGVRAEGLPHVGHLLGDGRGGGVLQGGDHGRLQVRPSRASISCAVSGPQEPGR